MRNVTDRVSNPFDMRPPCGCTCSSGNDRTFVPGYGDANADFHVIGDNPNVHGGTETGIPFTGTEAGERLQPVLDRAGLLADRYDDEPTVVNLFMSYLYMCCLPDGRVPTYGEYDELERFFDAELRAINAHVLLPVGERATERVIETYTTQGHRVELDMESRHATQLRGRGFLVVPVRDPAEWTADDGERLGAELERIRASDYRQTKGVATRIG